MRSDLLRGVGALVRTSMAAVLIGVRSAEGMYPARPVEPQNKALRSRQLDTYGTDGWFGFPCVNLVLPIPSLFQSLINLGSHYGSWWLSMGSG